MKYFTTGPSGLNVHCTKLERADPCVPGVETVARVGHRRHSQCTLPAEISLISAGLGGHAEKQ